jgi:hypothetical protein
VDELDGAIRRVQEALAALQAQEASVRSSSKALVAVATAVARAVALARFEALDERDGPFLQIQFGPTPQEPRSPMFPEFVAVRTTVEARVAALMESLEALQRSLVWEADCAEFTDARNNSMQYLRAAGYLEIAAETLVGHVRRA